MSRFVHLRAHSAYSLLEGAVKLDRLVELAASAGMPALGLCDRGNLFGALEFAEKAVAKGIQPIIGLTLPVLLDDDDASTRGMGRKEAIGQIALIAATEIGYRNLMLLSSTLFDRSDDSAERALPLPILTDHREGLIALTGGSEGPVNIACVSGHPDRAATRLSVLQEVYGDRLFIELQRHGRSDENIAEPVLLDLAYDRSLPIVATNQVFFEADTAFEAHDALRCIAMGRAVSDPERPQLTPEYGFKSPSDMAALFHDLPEAVAASIDISRSCLFRPVTRAPSGSRRPPRSRRERRSRWCSRSSTCRTRSSTPT
ncbi:MAG: PHP domain-containing protein, partial [Pseudomonadota bacterium]